MDEPTEPGGRYPNPSPSPDPSPSPNPNPDPSPSPNPNPNPSPNPNQVVERKALPNTTDGDAAAESTIEAAALNDALGAIEADERMTGLASPKARFFSFEP